MKQEERGKVGRGRVSKNGFLEIFHMKLSERERDRGREREREKGRGGEREREREREVE